MKVICDRAALSSAVALVAGVVNPRSPKPQLACVKLTAKKPSGSTPGALTLAATDGEVSLRMSLAQAEVQEAGELLVPAERLRAIVQAEEGDPTLTLESDQDVCVIKGQDAKFKVFGYPATEFPPVPEFPAADAASDIFAIAPEMLQRLISRTIFSVARENSRYAINGVLLRRQGKKLEMVATDGRRLALARGTAESAGSGEKSVSCIIQTKALNLLSRLVGEPEGSVRVAITSNQVIFSIDEGDAKNSAGATVLASSLVEGTFPPYEDVIPKDQDKKAKFDVGVLSSAVRRAGILTNEESRGVRMAFGGEKGGSKTVKLASRTPELGEAEVNVEVEAYEGGEIEIGFNPAYISDALKVLSDEQVMLELKAPNKPGVIKSGPDFLYVVMPVNLQ